jgi:hypothetical protein
LHKLRGQKPPIFSPAIYFYANIVYGNNTIEKDNKMGQSLKAKTDTDGEIEIAMQQYEIGLYVCIYKNGRMLDQFSLDTTEDEFIETLKKSKTIKLLPTS